MLEADLTQMQTDTNRRGKAEIREEEAGTGEEKAETGREDVDRLCARSGGRWHGGAPSVRRPGTCIG
jgi:hypothetical protein